MGYKDHPDGQACFQKVFEATKYTGAVENSVKVGFPAAVFLGLAAVLFKDSMQKGWEFFPKIYHKMGYIDYRKFDYTLTKDVSKDK
nr:uncharacterized protein LOC128686670 [Cherax quadricarinatus]